MPDKVDHPAYDPSNSGSCLLADANGHWSGLGRPIVDVADPHAPQDAATKRYVDSGIAEIASFWIYSQLAQIGDPGAGNLRTDVSQGGVHLSTQLAISTTSETGIDASAKMGTLIAGDVLELQNAADPTQWVRFELVATPVLTATWMQAAIAATEWENEAFANNLRVSVRIMHTARATRALLLEIAETVGKRRGK